MAMLAKRFQRTISMSQINQQLHADKAQAAQYPPTAINPSCVSSNSAVAADPCKSHKILNDQLLLQAATTQWETLIKARQQEDYPHHHHHLHLHQQKAAAASAASSPWQALKGISPHLHDDHTVLSLPIKQHDKHLPPASPPNPAWELLLKNAEAIMMTRMQQNGDDNIQNSHARSSATVRHEGLAMASSPVDVPHLPMGVLWSQIVSPVNSPSFSGSHDFLDSCFLCKQPLRHELDIFIYRGDAAFCSEDCRQRQILTDETRALRASTKGGTT